MFYTIFCKIKNKDCRFIKEKPFQKKTGPCRKNGLNLKKMY